MTHEPLNTSFDGQDADNIRSQLALYALGGLSKEESRRIESLLDDNTDLRQELKPLQETVNRIAVNARPLSPSNDLTDALMSRVEKSAALLHRQEAAGTLPAEPPVVGRPRSTVKPVWWQSLGSIFSSPLITGAALAGLIAMIGMVWLMNQQLTAMRTQVASLDSQLAAAESARSTLVNTNEELRRDNDNLRVDRQSFEGQLAQYVGEIIVLEQQLAMLREERDSLKERVGVFTTANQEMSAEIIQVQTRLEETEKVVALFSSPAAEIHTVLGTEVNPDAVGQVVIDPSSDTAILSVANLPPLEPGQVYQVLLIRGSEHDTAETFEVDTQGENLIIVHAPSPFSTFDTLGVSIEPAGGSIQRTGEIVLLGTLLN